MKYEHKDVVNGILNCISRFALIEESEIKLDSNLRNDLSFDSFDLIDTLVAIENWFYIAINDDDANNCKTVEDAVNLVIKCLKDKNEYVSND